MAQHENENPGDIVPPAGAAGQTPGAPRPDARDDAIFRPISHAEPHEPPVASQEAAAGEPGPDVHPSDARTAPAPRPVNAPRPAKRRYWQKFTLATAALGVLAVGGGFAAIRFKDKDERLKRVADFIEETARNPQGSVAALEQSLGALLPKSETRGHKGLVEPPAAVRRAAEKPAPKPEPAAPPVQADATPPASAPVPAFSAEQSETPKDAEAVKSQTAQAEATKPETSEAEEPITLEAPQTLNPIPEPPAAAIAAAKPAQTQAAPPPVPQAIPQPALAEDAGRIAEAPKAADAAPPPEPAKASESTPPAAPAGETVKAEDTSEKAELAARIDRLEALTEKLAALTKDAEATTHDRPAGEAPAAGKPVQESLAALESRVDALSEEIRALHEKFESPKAETRAEPEPADARSEHGGSRADAAATVVVAQALLRNLERGKPFAEEQSALTALDADAALLAALAPAADAGAPTAAQLLQSFGPLENRLRGFDAPKARAATFTEALTQFFSGLIHVRPANAPVVDTVSDSVAKIDAALRHDDAVAAGDIFERLPDPARAEAGGFGETLLRRRNAEKAANALLTSAIAALGRSTTKTGDR